MGPACWAIPLLYLEIQMHSSADAALVRDVRNSRCNHYKPSTPSLVVGRGVLA